MATTPSTQREAIPAKNSIVKTCMSIFEISYETASTIYNLAYAALIFGALLTVAGLLGLFWAEGIRTKHHTTEITQAQARSEEAKAQSAASLERAARLENDAAQARLEQEQLKQQNLELERSLAPRRFALRFLGDGKSNFDKIKPFKGMRVAIECANEGEPIRTANFLADLLRSAGWSVVSVDKLQEYSPAFTGISIESHISPRKSGEIPAVDIAAHEAANTLAKFLTDNNIVAHHTIQANMPLNMVRVIVGLKPDPFFFTEPPPERLRPKQ